MPGDVLAYCFFILLFFFQGFPGGSVGKESPVMQETWVWSLDWEDPLEKGKATHSSILAWRIPWLYSPWGHKESDMTEWFSLHLSPWFLQINHNQIIHCLRSYIKIWNHWSSYNRWGKFTFQRSRKCAFLFSFSSLIFANIRLLLTPHISCLETLMKMFNVIRKKGQNKDIVLIHNH